MALHPLRGAFERVRRAEEHLADLRNRLAWALRQQENAVTVQLHPDPPHHPVPILQGPTFADHRIGILIGEVCYNLRGALDYLVFELAKLDSGIEQDKTQFPIEGTKKRFNRRVEMGWLKGINPAHITAIEGLQPYNGCDWTKTLQSISNPDKHRELAPICGTVRLHAYTRALTPHIDEIAGTIHRAPHPLTGEEVEVKIYFFGNILLKDGTPIIEPLNEIKTQVANTLIAFKPDF